MYYKARGLKNRPAKTSKVYSPGAYITDCLAVHNRSRGGGYSERIGGLIISNCCIRLNDKADGIDPGNVPRENCLRNAGRFRANGLPEIEVGLWRRTISI